MDALIRYGLSIEEIQNMMDCNEEISNVLDSSIKRIISILKNIGLSDLEIISIIEGNPFILSRDYEEIDRLVSCIKKLGFNDLVNLFNSNPYLLSLSCSKFEDIFNQKINEGLNKEEAISYFYYNLVM